MVSKKSYTEIAKATGLSVSHVSRVMRGIRSPSVRTLSLIALKAGVPMSELIRRLKIGKAAKTIRR